MNNYSEIRQTVRSQFGVSPETVVIVQVSRMERWKGHVQLLSALTHLQDLTNWVCWIAGGAQRPQEHEYLKELQAQAQSSGLKDRIRFLGQRADIPALLAAADIHCQPNTSPEPFGITFIEALYAGLPVVTTEIGGGQEIVTPDCGRLIPPNNPKVLANTLKELIQSPQNRALLANQAPIRAKQLSDPQQQQQQLFHLLKTVI
ncbi:MAG: glycosyltransferase family 4 protein [Thermosynechococcaceae cyanobacterium MS004]|nr:glycosyltransferase family 4 protein [Thermosynechococcaceae cyanobacterium MS004]